MDDIYSNLENFTEENTIAELREENKNLKFKLDEYASALDKLQKVFDTLSSEHKKLELNYSSLLKTARSEIERKTQIITKLNIEKDTMVLNAIQNRNIPFNRRKPPKDNSTNHKEESMFANSPTQLNYEDSVKPNLPNPGSNERRKDNCSPSANTTALKNIQTRLLDIVNNTIDNPNKNSAKNNEVKENVNLKDDGQIPRAQISGRRKSMPAFSMDCAKFSNDEDEVASTEGLKESTLKYQSVKYVDKFCTNIEERLLGHKEYSKEFRSRYSKHDPDKHRSRENHEQFQRFSKNNSSDRNGKRSLDRRKGSSEKRRGSPDRNKRETRDHSEEFYKRQEYDRHKRLVSPYSPERRRGSPDRHKKETRDHSEEFYKRQEYERRKRLISPPRDKYYHEYKSRSRDSQRSNDRNHVQDFDRYKPHGQDMNTMKRKLHDYEEQSTKRSRQDSHHKHVEERRDERQAGPILIEVDDLHNMSCQSPDQIHLEAHPSHQAREIKLNSSTILDDPRLLSKKYTLKNHDGIPELSTVESANIEVKVIDASNWDKIETIKIPDALLKKPITSDTLSVSLLQKPMVSNRPDTLPQKTMLSDMPGASVQRLTSGNAPDMFIQNPISTDVPETNDQSPQKEMITHTPNNLTQKPNTTDQVTPDASTQKPMSTEELVKEIYMDFENPITNSSAESDDLYSSNLHGYGSTNNKTTHKICNHMAEPQKPENCAQKLGNYKIPKKSSDNTQNTKTSKNLQSLDKQNVNSNQKLNNKNKSSDNIKDSNKSTIEKREVPKLNEHKKTQRRNSDFQYEHQNLITAKDIIEGDLELSDENSDNTDVQIDKQLPALDKRDFDTKDVNLDSNKTHDLKTPDLKTDFDETSTHKVGKSSKEKSIKTTITETKKSKAKKQSFKLKDTKELHEQKDNQSIDQPINRKEDTLGKTLKNKDTLSLDQLVQIKESIKHELFKDETTCKDKPVKKSENKLRGPSKYKETVDKPAKKKENPSKELSDNKDMVPSTDNPVKMKENKPKEIHEKKETAMDKMVKRKGSKTKESQEHKNASVDKPTKKKQNKPKDYENTEIVTTIIDRQIKRKVSKPKETKFSELFGDSSSLVSPEDLGLVPRVVAPSETYVTMFDDAQDAIDMNTIRAAVTSATMEVSNDIDKTDTQENFNMNTESKNTTAITVEPTYPNIQEAVPAESTNNFNMYQNLQPDISSNDNDILRTVIISSGTQPQCVLEPTETHPITDGKNGTVDAELHIMQCVKPTVLQDIAMQALATSTPQKIWQQNVVQAEDAKISKCSNKSLDVSVDKTPLLADSNITTNSNLTNDADEPDVTIFVKRRRKIVRKK